MGIRTTVWYERPESQFLVISGKALRTQCFFKALEKSAKLPRNANF